MKLALITLSALFLNLKQADAQTDFAPGEIMFTGFNSDNPDAFSIVFLTDAVANTVIYVTDRGWDNSVGDGFTTDNTGEGTISFTFPNAYTCGSQFFFSYVSATNTWEVRDAAGGLIGNCVIQAGGDINGPELGIVAADPGGDQLFLYQTPEPTPSNQTSFVTAIHVNGPGWDADNNFDQNSEKPNGLSDFEVVIFGVESDNVKYDCSPNTGSGDYLQYQITNANTAGLNTPGATDNWTTSDIILALTPACNFCCLGFDVSAPETVVANAMFTIYITGILPAGQSWQLFTAGCGVGSPIQTTMADSFNVTAPGSEGTVTYYVRPSGLPCSGSCIAIPVCVENTPYAACTNCTADPDACGDCLMPDIYPNPVLDSGCFDIKLVFILDRSGSIGANAEDVEDGVIAFLEALDGQGIDIALIDFSSTARTVAGYTPLNGAFINGINGYFNGVPYNGFTYNPVSGGTNWHDAMIKADALAIPDIVMFFTDGIPTVWNTTGTDCGNGATTQLPEILNPVKLANKFKTEDTHMFMLGVGTGIDAYNLSLMSGPVEYDSAVNTIGNSDFSIGNFVDLAEDLADFVDDLCETPLELDKQVYGNVCNGIQLFRFIIHNPGTESAATVVEVIDTFPSGYQNPMYSGPVIKLCIGADCTAQGNPQPDNAFIWTTNSLPPGESDTLVIGVEVLPTGNYTNIAWAEGSNTASISDTVTSPNFVDDLDPEITCPPNITIECSEGTSPDITGEATAIDPDGTAPEVTYADMTIAAACPLIYTIVRTWTATDGCFNTDVCVQNILVEGVQPVFDNCAVTRNLIGCSTSVITGPPYSTTPAPSTEAVFEDANNQGVISDVCEINSIMYVDVASGTCPIVVTRTWTLTDVCGNSSTCNQTINVADIVAPNITMCAVTRNIEGCGTSSITGPPYSATTATSTEAVFENATNQGVVTDVCAISSVTYIDLTSGTCPTVVTRKWTISDACGNTATCNQTINVDDTVLPSITMCAVARNIEGCGTSSITGPSYSATTANSTEAVFENATNQGITSDACGITLVTYIDLATGTCPTIVTRKWTVSDACGNTATCNQTITVDDTGSPVITTCAITRNIEGCSTAAITGPGFSMTSMASTEAVFENSTNQGNISDACEISVTYIDVASDTCPIVVTRTWTLTDACGNSSTCNQTIHVDDTAAPTITTCAVTRNIEGCNTGAITGPSFSATPAASSEAVFENTTNQGNISDACGINSVTYIDVATDTCPIIVTRTWTIKDDCANVSTCNQIINVDDTVVPSIAACAITRNIEGCSTGAITDPGFSSTTATSSESVFENATNQGNTSDLCGITSVTYIDITAGTCPTVVTRKWTISDACGNTSTCNQTINVDDTGLPVISNCPVTRNFIGCSTAAITGPPYSPTTASSTEMQFENANNQGIVSDACGIASVTYIDVANGTCPIVVTRKWTVSDACGNTATCNQTLNVDDNTNPTISMCAVTRNIQGCSTSAITGPGFSITTATSSETVFENATNQGISSDACGITSVTYIDVATGTCPTVVTRTWTLSDACGNVSTCNQTINVDDTVNPLISPCAVTRNIEGCNTSAITGPPYSSTLAASSEAVFENATNQGITSDVCGITSVTYIDVAAGTCPTVVTRTWTLSDACGNSSTCNQIINVDDTTAPALTCPVNITIECTASTAPATTGNGTATDNCVASPVVTYTDVTTGSSSCPQEYTITRTWSTTDDCGNNTTCVQTITIDDSLAPAITCPSNLTIECLENTTPSNTGSATASDNCDTSPTITHADVTSSIPGTNDYLIQRTWSSTDDCGNLASCVQSITVINPLDPEILGDPYDTICSGMSVAFEAMDQGINPITYQWTFGSGSSPASAMGIGPHNVTYTYNGSNGTTGAWVILTVSTPGCASETDTVSNIHVNAIPSTAITVTPPGSPCVLQNKTFQPTAAEMPGFTYSWNFGAGASIPTAMGYGPHTVEYFTAGTKTVQLIVFSNEEGASCGDTGTVTFTVLLCPGNITGRVFKSDNTPIASVNVRLYADQNLDGIQDTTVAIRSVFTNAQGNYSMAALTPGYYAIYEIQPVGYFSLYDEDASEDFDSLSNLIPNNNIIPVTVEPSEIDSNNYFVEVSSPGIISGYVFQDFDNNEAPIPIEGLQGVSLQLHTDNNQDGKADAGGLVASTTTSSIGFYTFGDMAVGNYVITELTPAGYNNVKDFDASNDSDNVPNTNMTNDTLPVTLLNAENDEDNFFIEISPCSKVVTNVNDNGPGSLRYMIDCAEEDDTITFHPILQNQTLHLNTDRIEINKDLYIHSGLSPRLMIYSDVIGAFKIFSGKNVEFKNLNFTSGLSGASGATFENYGQLTLWDAIIYRNPLLGMNEYLIFNGVPGMITVKGSIQVDSN